jgi:hypothetical protein
MSAGVYHYIVEQGYDFSRTISWKDSSGNAIDLTDWSASSQITDRRGNVLADYSTDGGITVNGAEGSVTIWLLGATTASLDFDTANHFVRLVGPAGSAPDGVSQAKDKLIKGIVTLDQQGS